MKSLLAIDLSSCFWQAWHATAEAPVGEAVSKTLAQVTRIADGFDRVVICIDSPPYKRKELHPEYKQNREKQPALAGEQLRQVIDRLKQDGFPVVGAAGYEADDVIASVVSMNRRDLGRSAFDSITIATADKDLAQLLSDGAPAGALPQTVSILSTRTGDRMTALECETKFGVPPSQIRDWLALVGDSSDNIPGVKGIGPVHAAKLLKTYGTVETMLAKLDTVEPERFRVPIMQAGDQIRLALQLVTLATDCPIPWEEIDRDRVTAPRTADAEPAWHSEELSAEVDAMAAELVETGVMAPVGRQDGVTGRSAGDLPAVPSSQPSAPAAIAIPAGSGGPIQLAPTEFSLALEPRTMNGVAELAKALFNSKLYQKFTNPEAILAVILRGRELGLPAAMALDGFHVIEGKPSMGAHLIVGLVMRSHLCEYFECIESTDTTAKYETLRKGRTRPMVETFSIEDAVRMGALRRMPDGTLKQDTKSGRPGQWDKDPRNMLRVRCSTRLARLVYPDIVAGLYAPEEFDSEAA